MFASRAMLALAALPVATAGDGTMVHTPCGMRLRECVMEAPHGAVVASAGDGFRVTHLDGRIESVAVPEVCHTFAASSNDSRDARGTPAVQKELGGGVPDGWIKSAGVYQMDPSTLIHKFVGRWEVPAPPPVPRKPETVYYFIGLEDRTQGKLTSIHQPVLTWGDETEGGIGGWSLWSWTCCPKNITWHSTDVRVNPGDLIYGSIEKMDQDTWRIDGGFRPQGTGAWTNTTLTSQVGGYNFNYADVTLETYNVTDCDGMVQGSVDFTELELTLSNGASWTPPTWYVTGMPNNYGTKLDIVNATAMTISSGSSN